MDFVLESGSGEPDDPTSLPIHDQRLDRDLPFPEQNITSPDTPSFPAHAGHSRPERLDFLDDRANEGGNRQELGRSMGMSRGVHPGPRSWPLRDPDEATLLKHFVDRIASFVSSSAFTCNGPLF